MLLRSNDDDFLKVCCSSEREITERGEKAASYELRAASFKLQASSFKPMLLGRQVQQSMVKSSI